jgi:hypothetical protein
MSRKHGWLVWSLWAVVVVLAIIIALTLVGNAL